MSNPTIAVDFGKSTLTMTLPGEFARKRLAALAPIMSEANSILQRALAPRKVQELRAEVAALPDDAEGSDVDALRETLSTFEELLALGPVGNDEFFDASIRLSCASCAWVAAFATECPRLPMSGDVMHYGEDNMPFLRKLAGVDDDNEFMGLLAVAMGDAQRMLRGGADKAAEFPS